MSRHIRRSEGGRGGKLGRSNMDHWESSIVIKTESAHRRRTNDRLAIVEELEYCVGNVQPGDVVVRAAWQTASVLAVARRIAQTHDFAALPILADALEDAGCDNRALLTHCRNPGPHTRTCWVINLLLPNP